MFARTFMWLAAVGVVVAGGAEARAQPPPSEQKQSTEQASAPACRTLEEKVEFKTGSAMTDIEKRKLDAVATWLAAGPHRSVVVKGSTDPRGPAAYNEALSFRRARAVQGVLVERGVDPGRVIAVGEGERQTNGETAQELRSATVLLCQAPEPAAAAAAAPAPEPAPAAPTPEELAQATPQESRAEPSYQEPQITEQPTPQPTALQRAGFGLSLGGGVVGFTDDEARALADVGGSWELRAIFGTQLPLAIEGAYIGSAQDLVETVGISNDTLLLSHGVEGAVRLQLPTFYVRPYAIAGLGWTHYQLISEGINVSGVRGSDDVMTVPLGLGLTLRAVFGGTLDIRGTFRLAYYEDLMTGIYADTGANARLHTWNVVARLGWEF